MDLNQTKLTDKQISDFLELLKNRFTKNMHRHHDIRWENIHHKLKDNQSLLLSLFKMEETGGEPDVVGYNKDTNQCLFMDCSKETPSGRRSICYDREALNSRKTYKPNDTAIDMAKKIGIELLSEKEYRELQKLESFDLKTSSWILTPSEVRKLGGALFCDRRYDQVFVYHNGAESYYASRGFRGILKV
ncbi:MAG: DUF4256 domain-containing protein [Tenericutes bacterium]|nr:DUF4256 domain-containing protein [Mycoplasmatota bacterium]